MLKKISFSLLFFISLIMIMGVINVNAGLNETTTESTGLRDSSSTSLDVTLDNATSITNITINRGTNDRTTTSRVCNGNSEGSNSLGSVSSYNLNGENLRINFTGSTWDRADCDDDYYSDFISDYRLGNVSPSSSNTYNYSSNGYSGTLTKQVNDTRNRTDTRKVEAATSSEASGLVPNSINYSSNGYYGTLTKSGSPVKGAQTGGSYQSADSKYIDYHPYSHYSDAQGYSGPLSHYTYRYGHKTQIYIDRSVYTLTGNQCKSVYSGSNYWYDNGAYSGTLYFEVCIDEAVGTLVYFYPSYTGEVSLVGSGYRGTVYRPEVDTRIYEYTQNYSGNTNRYDYEGTVYRGEWVNREYIYNVTINYRSNRAPSIDSLNLNNDRFSEVSGYNVINLSGRASDPDNDRLTIHYEIANASGSMNINSGSNYSFNIPINSSIPEGTHTLRVWADDNDIDGIRTTSPVSTRTIIVDKTNPLGNLREVNGPQSYQIDLDFYNVDATIAGAHSNPYRIQRSVNNGSFSNIYGWASSDRFNDTDVLSNTKYSYRGNLRDIVGHEIQTNWVEFVTSPRVDYIGLMPEDASTIVIELEQTLPNGVVVEVQRSGSLVAIIESGNEFIDPNLDYERNYTYQLTAVTTDRFGNRMESVPITVSQWTGVPDLELTLDHPYDTISNQYLLERTIFSDKVDIKGDVFYRHGGDVDLTYTDKTGDNLREMKLNPYETKPFEVTTHYNEGDISVMRASLLDRGMDISDSENIRVSIKEVIIERLSERKRDLIYD